MLGASCPNSRSDATWKRSFKPFSTVRINFRPAAPVTGEVQRISTASVGSLIEADGIHCATIMG